MMKQFLFYISIIFLLQNCNFKKDQKLFTQLSSSETHITFSNNLNETENWNIIKYLYYYNGGGVAVGDINNDGLPDLAFSANQLPNKLYLNLGNIKFEDITEKANFIGHSGEKSWKTGISMADVNGDGYLDIYVCQVGFYKGINGKNELYINQQDGTFEERAADFGLDFKGFSQQAAWFDYDLDGDLDLYLVNHSVHSPSTFVESDKRKIRNPEAGDRLFRNEGILSNKTAYKFTDVSEEAGVFGGAMGFGLAATIGDLNNDGYPDIYVSNDFHENDYLYINNQNGTFSEKIKENIGHTSTFSMGSDIADLDNDGWLDILTLDMQPADEKVVKHTLGADRHNLYFFKLDAGYHYQHPRNALQWNRGNLPPSPLKGEQATAQNLSKEAQANDSPPFRGLGGNHPGNPYFSETAQFANIAETDWSWSTLAADFDNDGWKDIFITNGIWRRPNDLDYLKFASDEEIKRNATDAELAAKMPSGKVKNYAFRNLGSDVPKFEDVSEKWGLDLIGCSNGAIYSDLDLDGDLDLVVNNLNVEASVYRNNARELNGNNYLRIDSNLPIGTKITIETESGKQVQELTITRGWQSSLEPIAHFGLGQDEIVTYLNLERDMGKAIKRDVKANQSIDLVEFIALEPPNELEEKSNLFKEISIDNLNFQHKENKFLDYNIESLLPHQLSKEGPALAIGYINNDGLEDVFFGGAKVQNSEIYVQNEGMTFAQKNITELENDRMHEDVAATFFDADNDGDQDLYVVSGGGEYREGSKLLQDRLYFNNSKGASGNNDFLENENALPEIKLNGSCVVAADFNEDGAMDLFIGSRSVPASYGVIPESVILINNGKGNFSKGILPNEGKMGMVTDAVWVEKEKQLVVVGEWMRPTILKFVNGSFELSKMGENGWWNCVEAADLDQDGDTDLLLGNQGLNFHLTPIVIGAKSQPVELFIADFDNNYQTDPILTYYKNSKRYTVFGKDDLTNQLTVLRKRFTDYQSFSQADFENVAGFDEQFFEKAATRKATTFASVILENQDSVFISKHLPEKSQLSAIQGFITHDFDKDGNLDILAVGNFYHHHPIIGKNDASYGHFLKGDGKGNFEEIEPRESGFAVFGDARKIELIGNKTILVAKNSGKIQVFEIQKR